MVLETNRLYLTPLSANQLGLWCTDIEKLESELNCSYQAEPVEGFFKEIILGQEEKTKKDNENYLFHTFFFLIRKSDRIVVGSSDFKDVPNIKGEVEIGYGLGKEYEHQGYMTEAVKAMCDWGLSQSNISHIIAETESDGIASQNILKRCGFTLYDKSETYWWRL